MPSNYFHIAKRLSENLGKPCKINILFIQALHRWDCVGMVSFFIPWSSVWLRMTPFWNSILVRLVEKSLRNRFVRCKIRYRDVTLRRLHHHMR